MTIKDMELQTGLARANIRYYEAEGLIAPERAENGYREYSQEDAETLLRVKLLRALGQFQHLGTFLVTDDDIIICDPEAEYAPLVERLHGQVIHISPASTQYINPMDINSNYSEDVFHPAPFLSCPRFLKLRLCPSILTTSNNKPHAHASIDPLKPKDSYESHCTKAFGPAAQYPAAKS